MNPTTHPRLRSFVPVAPDSHFPIQNLPYGVFRRRSGGPPRIGVAIGDYVLDLAMLHGHGLLRGPAVGDGQVFQEATLNAFMALGRPAWSETRAAVSRLLREDEPALRDNTELRERALVPMAEVELLLPAAIGDYTDFYSSKEHAGNVGTMLRGPENALMPNWLHLPVAYHGRASSVVVSGTDLHRPLGQSKPADAPAPVFGPSRSLDIELEMGYFVGPGNELGRPIPVERATEHIFGLVLVNDWSARDIQAWEYQPLGPFLGKSFATSIAAWITPLEAFAAARVPVVEPAHPRLPYLVEDQSWGLDLSLSIEWNGTVVSRPRFADMSYSCAQQLAHMTVNGATVRPGDLFASGTVSGPSKEERGCFLELTWAGREPVSLEDGEKRTFLEDGDTVVITATAPGEDGSVVGLAEVAGTVLPAEEVT